MLTLRAGKQFNIEALNIITELYQTVEGEGSQQTAASRAGMIISNKLI